jgi:hypothetical protein
VPGGGRGRVLGDGARRPAPTALAALGALVAAAAAGAAPGCEDGSHRDIGVEINILTRRNDALVPPATERLARYGRLAVPQIETALHTAAPTGRLHLVAAIDRIGDEEAIPVLRHVAVYDVSADVRQACADVLARWSAAPAAGAPAALRRRAERARAAEAEIARKRAAGEGPMVADGGLPGVPTVGAPEPVGSELDKPRR